MQQKQRKKRTALLTGLLTLCTLWMGWGQGLEDFTNLPSNNQTTYQSRTWTGTDNVIWTAEGARTDQTIDGKAICFGNSGTRNVTSPTYSGGMGTLTFDYVRAFTGTNARSLEVYVNGNQIGSTITVSTTSDDVITYNEDINVSGDVVLEIRSTGAAQVKLDNISWTGFSGSAPLLTATPTTLTNFEYIEGSGPSASQSVDVSGINLDPAAGTINVAAPANFEVSLDDNTFADDVDMAYTAGEFTDETVYVRLKSGLAENTYNGDITISGGDAADITVALLGAVIAPSYTTLPYNQTFDTDLGDTYVYNVAGTTTWEHSNGTANANGFNGQDPEEQWLVLPGIDFSAYNDALMTFTTTAQYGTIDANNYLKLFYSTDYTGLGNPTTATWTELTFDLPGSVSSSPVSTPSGVVDLATINASEVFIAFQYYSSNSPTSWSVDDITIQEAVPTLTANPTGLSGLNYMDGNGPSAAQQFELSGVSLDNSNVTLTAPADFEISEDDNTYSSSITLSAYDGTPTDIYVRLQSGLAEAAYNGDITISGGGITGNITVALSGEVTPFIDQYAGVGVFELVTSLAELEDGYYVVANETSEFLMINGRDGSPTTGYFLSDDLILDANDNVVNPATDRVWYIEANGAGYTIYNDVTEKYVGWQSGNAASIEDNVSDISRWTFIYQDDKFTVNNVATPVRQLSYNSGAPRFAAYGNTNQHELQLYKYTIPTDPILTAAPLVITGLNYTEGEGPSAAQSFEVSGMNLDPLAGNINVEAPANFEVSLDDISFADDVDIAYTAGEFTDKTVYVRLKSGLTENTYNGDITISGGDAADVTVAVDGEVTPIPQPELLTDPTSITGLNYMDGNGPSAAQQFELSGVALDNSNVTLTAPTDFEISEDDITYSNNITLTAYDGTPTDIYVRLQDGLTEDTYSGDITISGGGMAGNITVALSGEVTPLFLGTIETFDNSNATVSYSDNSFVGNGGITWTYVHSRNGNNDANGSGINLPALMLRDDTNDSKITSETIPGGIGDFSVKLYKGFTGAGNRQVELFINGVSQGTSTPFDDFNEHIFAVNGINISGNIVIEIRNITSNQIIIDDIAWTSYATSTPTLSVIPTTLSGFEYIEGSGPSVSQSFEVSGLNLDPLAGDINVEAPANFEVSLDDTTFADDVDIAYTAGEFTDETIYVRLKSGLTENSYNGDITISGGDATDIAVALSGTVLVPSYTTLPYNETFDTNLGDTYVYNVAGTTTWVHSSGTANANGFNGQDPEEQWLILPGIDFSSYNDALMTFTTIAQYGVIDADNFLKLFYSTDYAGLGDPTTATWTELTFDLPGSVSASPISTPSGVVDLSAINGSEVFIAFQYYSTNNPTSWSVDDIMILEPVPTLVANPTTLSGLTYMDGNGPSAAQLFELSGVALNNSDVTLTAPADFEISEDDITYSNNITLTAYDGTPTDIYVRLQDGLTEDTYSGDITISGGGMAGNITVALSGEVTPFVDQYNGVGVFELVTSLAGLEDGYYVISEATDAYAMNNTHNGTFLARETVTIASNTIVNPGTHLVWYIEVNGAGHTIYNDNIEKFLSYTGSGNNIQIVDNVTADNQRWTVTYNIDDEFIIENLAENGRILQYNATSGQERFAAYTSNQRKLHLYKWIELNDPVLSVNPTTLSGLNYIEGSGPSVSQSFEVSGLNLDTTDVTASVAGSSDFELSADDVTYGDTVTLTAFDGTATTIYARLKAGLLANNYTDDVAIAGGGATAISVTLEGDVFEPFDLPYFNGLRNQTDWDQAQLDGFTFTNESFETGTGGYVRLIGIGSNITTPTIDFTNYDIIKVSFDLTTYGGDAGQELTVYVSDDDGVSYTPLGSLAVPSSYETFTEYIDVSGSVSTIGRIKFEMSNGSNSIRFRDLDMDTYSGYVYSGGLWSPSDPLTTATPADDILIVDGTAVLNADFEINNITVANSATLAVENILTVQGDIENNGAIVFVSTSEANTAQFDTFNGTITGNGTVTTERFIPARRAFRFLSSAVTTTSSINANWQEGVNNPDVNTNLNPNPGFGTHISGSATGDNGFDATGSGNPSLFGFANTTQTWTTISNTDINTLTAGAPYRLMVRGDRGIDLSSNSSPATDTRLRATGQLHTGTYTNTTMGQNPDDFNLVGNPYQAAIDMEAVLASSTNLNENAFFVWDPTQGVRGAYVAVDIADGGSSNPSSDANQYLQPGQAAFVTTLNAGAATYTVEEHHKAVSQSGLEVFNILAEIDLRLYNQTAWSNDEKPADGLRIKFKNDGSNAVDSYDILKLPNLDENIATLNNGHVLAIESRSMPVHEDVIPLFINQHRDENYVFTATLNHIDQVDVYLRDYFTQDEIALENDTQNIITFSVDENIPESIATDRFEIFFKEKLVGLDDHNHQNIALYPNPSEGAFYLSVSNGEQAVQVRIVNMVGQVIYEQTHTTNANGTVYVTANQAQNGVYLVYVSTNDGTPSIIRWINQ